MLTPETQPDHYTEKPPVGMSVLYWPKGVVDKDKGTPLVGFIQRGWDLGMADIAVLPEGDGAVMSMDGVFHIGDQRIFDFRGNVSSAAGRKGVWEPSFRDQDYVNQRIKELGIESKKKRPTAKAD